jgi:negative regulator of flagellin synthesis FlgM
VKIEDAPKKNDGVGVKATSTRGSKSADKAGSASKTAAAATLATDSVHLSTQMQSLTQIASNSSVFDTNKVEEIKTAIAEGRFKVDPEKVAYGLLDTVTDLLHKRKA